MVQQWESELSKTLGQMKKSILEGVRVERGRGDFGFKTAAENESQRPAEGEREKKTSGRGWKKRKEKKKEKSWGQSKANTSTVKKKKWRRRGRVAAYSERGGEGEQARFRSNPDVEAAGRPPLCALSLRLLFFSSSFHPSFCPPLLLLLETGLEPQAAAAAATEQLAGLTKPRHQTKSELSLEK